MNVNVWDDNPEEGSAEAAGLRSNATVGVQPGTVFNAITGTTRAGSSAAFLDIHYHGSSSLTGMSGQEAAGVAISPSSLKTGTGSTDIRMATQGVVTPRLGGSAAFLDIHYHGSSATNLAAGVSRPGGSAAFLDIHYHGSSLAGMPGQEAAGATAISPSAVKTVSAATGISRLAGSAAFLDIHYHGSSATNLAAGVSRPGGSAAFLDIHYHGSSLAGMPGQEAASSGPADQPEEGSLHIYGE